MRKSVLMRIITCAVTFIMIVGITVVISSCSDKGVSALAYEVNEDGITCTVTGIGKCKDPNISIPSKLSEYEVTAIGDGAFSNCKLITSIEIPETLTSIGASAFSGCSGLTSLTIPNSVTSIGANAFQDCTAVATVTVPMIALEYLPKDRLETVVLNSSESSIGENAFSGSSKLVSITIPNTVTIIGKAAFRDCSSLSSITVPDGVTSIGSHAFAGCSSLSSITVPNGVTSIGSHAFAGCSSLTGIQIPNGVTSIDSETFKDCSSLKSISVPDSVTSIGNAAFSGCTSLESITLPFVGANENDSSNEHFGYIFGASSYIFNKDYVPASLKKVVLTGGSSIGKSAFYGCENLTDITIPKSVKSIGASAFHGCGALKSIKVPSNVKSIGKHAFNECYGLESITLPFIGGKKDDLEHTSFSYVMGSYTQETSLKTVVLTGGSFIAEMAFYGWESLTEITLPKSISMIELYAFRNCTSLRSITYKGTVAQWSEIYFGTLWYFNTAKITVTCSDRAFTLTPIE